VISEKAVAACRLLLIVELAYRDYVHDWAAGLFAIVGLAAVLAPLMVLLGLKIGAIGALNERLIADPATRELRVFGQGRFDKAFLAALRDRPETGFVVPATRFLAATADLVGLRSRAEEIELWPTAASDPFFAAGQTVPQGLFEAALSDSLATRLGLAVGDQLKLVVSRGNGTSFESAEVALRVTARIIPRFVARDVALVPLDLLEAAEDWRTGNSVTELGWQGTPRPARAGTYPSFRLFAKTIDDVAPLRGWLLAHDLEVSSQLDSIATIRVIDRNLSWLFAVVAGLGACGLVVSLAAAFLTATMRRQRELSTLLVLGFNTVEIASLPLVQAVLTALAGFTLSCALYGAVAGLINSLFAAAVDGRSPCRLPLNDIAAAGGLTLLIAVGAATLSGFRAASVEPAAGLREE
jgi:putative ABC transport system permease protein